MTHKSTIPRTFLFFSCLVLQLGGCSADPVWLGELRCEGEGTICDSHALTVPEPSTMFPDEGPERELELLWTTPIECGDTACWAQGMVVHEDESITLVTGQSAEKRSGPTILRFDREGVLESTDDSLTKPKLLQGALAVTSGPDGEAYLAASGHEPELEGGPALLGVYRMDREGGPTLVFSDDDSAVITSMIVDDDGNFVLAGGYGGLAMEFPIEVTSYAPDGTLRFRQSHLSQSFQPPRIGAFPPSSQSQSPRLARVDGTTYVITHNDGDPWFVAGGDARPVTGLAALDAAGNVRWHAWTSVLAPASLIIDTGGEPLVGGVGNSGPTFGPPLAGYDGYLLQRFDDDDPSTGLLVLGRTQTRFQLPLLLALASDPQGRLLVVSKDGDREAMFYVIDRYDEGLARRDSFRIRANHGATCDATLETCGANPPVQLHALPDGRIVFMTGTEIGMFASLPD